MSRKPPLVYSCSGCSSAAQMANQIAIRLDRDGAAEMSCIAGVGGGVTGLVKTAQSGRPILALDGCVLACVAACLANAGVRADTHLVLADYGVKKRKHADVDQEQAAEVYVRAVLPAAQALKPGRACALAWRCSRRG
jgi:uncharacterized metal-binding protein